MTKYYKSIIEKWLCKFPNFYLSLRSIAGCQDWEKNTFLKTIKPNWTVIEIGANQGYFTVLFQKLIGNSGSLLAFEPIPSTYNILQKSVPEKPNNFNLFNLGTGKSDLNNVEFFLPVNDHGQATMSPHSSDSWKNQEIKKVYCNVICLDNFEPIESLEHIHFIKIDVEGAELPSLIGAKRLLAMHKPILFFEGCMQWMKSFQYSPQDFDQFLVANHYKEINLVGKKLKRIQSLENFFADKKPNESFNFLAKYR